jgi:excinuclease UvrABC nuclease subunit
MQQYAKNLQFEEAAKIKEDLLSLQSLSQNQIVRDIV